MDQKPAEDIPPESQRPSLADLAACLLAVPMIVMELRLLALVLRGVKDNQGYLYAAFPTLAVLVLGLSTCLLLVLAGLMQRSRSRSAAWLGLVLALGVAISGVRVILAAQRPERPRPHAAHSGAPSGTTPPRRGFPGESIQASRGFGPSTAISRRPGDRRATHGTRT